MIRAPAVAMTSRALGSLGLTSLPALRAIGLAWSVLALALWFAYLRRMFTARVALIATALFATSPLWLLYADSLHEAPLAQLGACLALWGVARACETGRVRHQAAMVLGACLSWLSSFDFALVLPLAALATIYLQTTTEQAARRRRLVALLAAAAALSLGATLWWMVGAVGWSSLGDELRAMLLPGGASSAVASTLVRRLSLVFTPLFWVAVAVHVVRAIRAPTLGAAIRGTAVWFLVGGLASLALAGGHAGARMLCAQALLPFYALATARLLDEMLDRPGQMQRAAYAWLVAAPLWSAYVVLAPPRSVLAPSDVAQTRAYFAAADRNDFVLSNLGADGPLWAAFHRHEVAMPSAKLASTAPRAMLAIFDRTGADVIHAILFTDAPSRAVDRAMWKIAPLRRAWATTGWPQVNRGKTAEVIREYDDRVRKNLAELDATRVLKLGTFEVYRIERAAIVARLTGRAQITRRIDFTSIEAQHHELGGWSLPTGPTGVAGGPARSEIIGMRRCRADRCPTVRTLHGLETLDAPITPAAQAVIRVNEPCDHVLALELTDPGLARISLGGVTSEVLAGVRLVARFPARAVRPGLNTVTIEGLVPGVRTRVAALDVAASCGPESR